MHLSAPLPQRDRKDLERVSLLEQKSVWIQNEFVHDGSVKHPSTPTSSSPKPPRRADRWTARAAPERFCRGWVGDIDSMSTVLGERRGQRRFPYKANSGPISSHILSGGFFLPSPLFLFLPLSALHLFSLSFLFC